MYISDKPRPIDFYKEEDEEDGEDMMIEVLPDQNLPHHHHHQQIILADDTHTATNNSSSGGEEEDNRNLSNGNNIRAPKKRAETWAQDETRSLISLRREMDCLFNTSKSNKHLWDQISTKMRDRGFDRSPTMCTDKWRNLLKEFKKARNHHKGSRAAKMLCYKEIEEILRERNKNSQSNYKSPSSSSRVESYVQFSDKGIDDTSITFGSLDADTVQASGVPPWNWRETPGNGADSCGRVITVKWGDYTRKIGIDAKADAIKEAIRAVFGLRTQRAFWLEDEDGIVRSIDREMPVGDYNLRLDEGISIKVCFYDDSDPIPVHTEDKTFYTEDDLHSFLTHRNWTSMRELDGYASVDSLNDIRPGAIYRGIS